MATLADVPRDLFLHVMRLTLTERAALCCTSVALARTVGIQPGERRRHLIYPGEALYRAVTDDHPSRVHQLSPRLSRSWLKVAVRAGALAVLDAFCSESRRAVVFELAVIAGQWEVLQRWDRTPSAAKKEFPYSLLRAGARFEPVAWIASVIQRKRWDIIRWLEERFFPGGQLQCIVSSLGRVAVATGDIAFVDWVLAGPPWPFVPLRIGLPNGGHMLACQDALTAALCGGQWAVANHLWAKYPALTMWPHGAALQSVRDPSWQWPSRYAAVDQDRVIVQASECAFYLARTGQLARIAALSSSAARYRGWFVKLVEGACHGRQGHVLDWLAGAFPNLARIITSETMSNWVKTIVRYGVKERGVGWLARWVWRQYGCEPYVCYYGNLHSAFLVNDKGVCVYATDTVEHGGLTGFVVGVLYSRTSGARN